MRVGRGKLRLRKKWKGARLRSVKSELGSMRVKHVHGRMFIQEHDGRRWLDLRSFTYNEFVRVYPRFKVSHGNSITFYLEEA